MPIPACLQFARPPAAPDFPPAQYPTMAGPLNTAAASTLRTLTREDPPLSWPEDCHRARLRPDREAMGSSDAYARAAKKSQWGPLSRRWVPHDTRDQIVDYVNRWTERTEISAQQLLGWAGIPVPTFTGWRKNYGRAYEHNGWIPRDNRLTLNDPPVSLRRTGLCREATRASERCRRQVL